MEMTLTLSRKPSSTCDRAWPTSRLTPARIRMSVIDSTAARLTARFRQKLCQALLSANLRFRKIIVISAGAVVSSDLPRVDRDDAAAEKVHDLSVVGRHHNCGAPRVDAQELEVLEHEPHLAPVVGQLAPLHAAKLDAVDEDLALGRFLLADQQADKRGFPGARGTHQEEEVALRHLEVDVAEGFGSSWIR